MNALRACAPRRARARRGGERTAPPAPPAGRARRARRWPPRSPPARSRPAARPRRARCRRSSPTSTRSRAAPGRALLTVVGAAHRSPQGVAPRPGRTQRVHSRVGSGVAVGVDEILTTASVVLGAEHVIVRDRQRPAGRGRARRHRPDPQHRAAARAGGLELPRAARWRAKPPKLGDWVIALGSSYGAAPTQSVGNIAFRFREPRLEPAAAHERGLPGQQRRRGAQLARRTARPRAGRARLARGPGPPRARRTPAGRHQLRDPAPRTCAPSCDGAAPGRPRAPRASWASRRAARSWTASTQPGAARADRRDRRGASQPGGPAERAGLRKGDLIVAFEDAARRVPRAARALGRRDAAGHGREARLGARRDAARGPASR